jgi:hypothetical protein
MTYRSRPITITRRTLALAILASGALGIGIGEMAAPLQSSQAHARVAAAPAVCRTFENSVGTAFTILGTILQDAARYPPLIPQAYQAGVAHSSAKYAAVGRQLLAITALIQTQDKQFNKIKGPLIAQGKACIA